MVDIGEFIPVREVPENVHTENKKEEPKFKFDHTDLENCVLHLIKRNSPYEKTYTILQNVSVTVHDLTDQDLMTLNSMQQELSIKGDRRKNRVYFTDPNDENSRLGHEVEVYANTDSYRQGRINELSMYLVSIDNEVLPKETNERIEFLQMYSKTFLDYIYNKVLLHFKALVEEAAKRFEDF